MIRYLYSKHRLLQEVDDLRLIVTRQGDEIAILQDERDEALEECDRLRHLEAENIALEAAHQKIAKTFEDQAQEIRYRDRALQQITWENQRLNEMGRVFDRTVKFLTDRVEELRKLS